MYQEFYHQKQRGFTEDEFKNALEEAAGCCLNHIYEHYINGLDELDYNHYLGYAGLKLRICPPENKPLPTTGFTAALKDGKLLVTHVERGTAAWHCGINVNDELLLINSNRIIELEKSLQYQQPGDMITIMLIRDGRMLHFDLELQNQHKIKYQIEDLNEPTYQQIAVRNKWLKL